jgi:hypothetical protein
MKKTKSIKTNGMKQPKADIPEVKLPDIDSVQLYDALAYVQECMERAQIPFIVLRELALNLFLYQEDMLKANEVVIGTYQRNMVDTCVSTLESILQNDHCNYIKTDRGYEFIYKDVPCEIRIIKKHFSVLDDPDKRMFGWSWVYIPNPFQQYWKGRSFV